MHTANVLQLQKNFVKTCFFYYWISYTNTCNNVWKLYQIFKANNTFNFICHGCVYVTYISNESTYLEHCLAPQEVCIFNILCFKFNVALNKCVNFNRVKRVSFYYYFLSPFQLRFTYRTVVIIAIPLSAENPKVFHRSRYKSIGSRLNCSFHIRKRFKNAHTRWSYFGRTTYTALLWRNFTSPN